MKEGLNAVSLRTGLLGETGSLESFTFSDHVGLPFPVPLLNFPTSFPQPNPLVSPASLCETGSVALHVCALLCICGCIHIHEGSLHMCKSNHCWYSVHIQIHMRLACLPEYVWSVADVQTSIGVLTNAGRGHETCVCMCVYQHECSFATAAS